METLLEQSTASIRVMLVDDQPMIGEAVRRMLLTEAGLEYLYCSDPTQAMQKAAEFAPTVILQDLVMPEVDGLTMLKFYRANPATREIPVVVLSTKEEPKVKAEAFTLGASDYLVKLPDPVELLARIRMHSRGYIAQRERNAAYVALKNSEARLAEELAEAARYLTSLLPAKIEGALQTDWAFIPSAELGGDTLGYAWLDEDHFAMYLLDVCGHGLKAALLSISAMNVLRNQTLPNTDFLSPSSVLSGMNEAFQMERHNFMYFTLWYGVFNRKTRELTYGNAGHPPAILMAGAAPGLAKQTILKEHGLIIGAMPDVAYQSATVRLPAYARLYFFSDGLFEITRPDQSMMTFEEFAEIVAAAPTEEPALESILATVRAARGQESFEDDLSIVEATFREPGAADGATLPLAVEASLEGLAAAAAKAEAWLAERHVEEPIRHLASLVLEEIVTNCIKYGFPAPGERAITAHLSLTGGEFAIAIEDNGRAFNPLAAPEPDLSLPVEEREAGGVGLYLLRQMSDACSYERRDGRNRVVFRKQHAGGGESSPGSGLSL